MARRVISWRERLLAGYSLAVLCVLAPSHALDVDDELEALAREWVRQDPDLATARRYLSGAEQDRLERQLTPHTRAWHLERVRLAKRGIRRLKALDRGVMTPIQQVSADLLHWQLESVVKRAVFLDYAFPLEQFRGANVQIVEALTVQHPLQTPRDADNYLARLEQADERMDEAVRAARRLVRKRLLPPRFIIQSTLASLQTFVGAPADDNPLVTTFAQKIAGIATLSAAEQQRLRQRAVVIVGEQVYPAWRRAIALLESAVPFTDDRAGLWRFPNGAVAYAEALARFTTTDLSAERIHDIGLNQVARIEAEMDAILRRLGRVDGTVRERINQLSLDLRYPNPDSDTSRAHIMRDLDALMRDAMERSAALFERVPKTPVIAQPFPRFREASAAAGYQAAPLDGSRPAIFQIPLRSNRMTRFGLRSLVYHETIPGHHFQIALELENESLPRFRRARVFGGVAAASEGWALYAERLVAEAGWYEGDPEGLLGQLNAELFRARRLVVDTGLHAKQWTRQQAIDYGIEPSEVERYVVNPGQACAYMIGQLKLFELREYAQRALGERFVLKDFHSVVMNAGTVPLTILEREVKRHVQAASVSARR